MPLTSGEVDNRRRSCRDGVDLRVDLVLRLVHLVLDPHLGRLGPQTEGHRTKSQQFACNTLLPARRQNYDSSLCFSVLAVPLKTCI